MELLEAHAAVAREDIRASAARSGLVARARWDWWLAIRCAFLALAVLYVAIPNARPDFTRFNAHDSESYLALADSLVHGRGYTRSLIQGAYVPHSTWPPGMAVIVAPAIWLGGDTINWLAAKWTMVLVGLMGMALVVALVHRLTASYPTSFLALLLIGLNPFYWDFSHQVMSEIPLVVWIVGAWLLVDRWWAARRVSWWQALAAGFVCGLGMLIKGQALGLALLPLAYLFGPRRSTWPLHRQAVALLLFWLTFAVPFGAWTLRNRTIHPSGLDGVNQVAMLFQRIPGEPGLKSGGEIIGTVIRNLRAVHGLRGARANDSRSLVRRSARMAGERLGRIALDSGPARVLQALALRRARPCARHRPDRGIESLVFGGRGSEVLGPGLDDPDGHVRHPLRGASSSASCSEPDAWSSRHCRVAGGKPWCVRLTA